jgi:putative redox protein
VRSVTVAWDGAAGRFTATGNNVGHVLAINAPLAPGEERPPTGFSAKELLLAGAGACSAWDVVEILRKQRAAISAFDVVVEGEQASTPPYAFEHITLHYRLSGAHLRPGVVKRTIRLSVERYCSVLGTVRGVAQIAATVELIAADGTSSGRTPVDLAAAIAPVPVK